MRFRSDSGENTLLSPLKIKKKNFVLLPYSQKRSGKPPYSQKYKKMYVA